jgi:hypothetical protein
LNPALNQGVQLPYITYHEVFHGIEANQFAEEYGYKLSETITDLAVRDVTRNKSVVISFLGGIVFGMLLITLKLNFQQDKQVISLDKPTDWKMTVDKASWNDEKEIKKSDVYFGYKYPSDFEKKYFGVCKGVQGCGQFLGRDEEIAAGDIMVTASLYWFGGRTPIDIVSSTPATLGGKEALRLVRHIDIKRNYLDHPKVWNIEYRVRQGLNIDDSEHGFSFSCYHVGDPYKNMEKLCDQIAETLVFESSLSPTP